MHRGYFHHLRVNTILPSHVQSSLLPEQHTLETLLNLAMSGAFDRGCIGFALGFEAGRQWFGLAAVSFWSWLNGRFALRQRIGHRVAVCPSVSVEEDLVVVSIHGG